jgi:hypothetical protein
VKYGALTPPPNVSERALKAILGLRLDNASMITRLSFGYSYDEGHAGFSRFAARLADMVDTGDGLAVRHRTTGPCHAPGALVTVC